MPGFAVSSLFDRRLHAGHLRRVTAVNGGGLTGVLNPEHPRYQNGGDRRKALGTFFLGSSQHDTPNAKVHRMTKA